jgi:hypothetical protein
MYLSSIVENSTIDVVVENSLDILRYKRAMYSLKSVAFSYVGQVYDGQVLAVRPHADRGPEAWLVKMIVKPHVEQPPRPRLKRYRRADGSYSVQ